MSNLTTAQLTGLTHSEIETALANGAQTNYVRRTSSRPLSTIIRANIFTLFNAILTTAMIVVILIGSWQDAVFAIVMISNAVIGIISETKAKRTLDSLAILEAPRAKVIRDGNEEEISSDEILLNELVVLRQGSQVPADGITISSQALKIDESMLTGESVAVRKSSDDQVLSGTVVVAGEGIIRTTAIGKDAYAQQLTEEAKKFKKAHSEIVAGINVILKVISWAIVPIVALLVWSQLNNGESDWRGALILAIAGVVGMIPQGLVLLTSLNFALAAAGLARQKVLIQELNAVEVLARVDRLCVDKTGTLTSGAITGREIIELTCEAEAQAYQALSALVGDAANETAVATLKLLESSPLTDGELIPFDSTRKWSAFTQAEQTWYFGAPEIVAATASNSEEVLRQVNELAQTGARVLCLAKATEGQLDIDNPVFLTGLKAILLVVLEEEIRPDAADTMAYFLRQKVQIKVISGDNPTTVGAIAKRVGVKVEGDIKVMDARELAPEILTGDMSKLAEIMAEYDVFGRVTPEVKRAMVHALQHHKHTVAMTGDGVNDVLALKDADLGIAMGSGAQATKAVAKVVLVDGKFAKLPAVVAEGRRIIANMERVSSLFLTKTTYSALLAIIVSVMAWKYPFLPRHLTIIGSLTIGIPSFFLAMEPNFRIYRPGFLERTLWLAIPSGVTLALAGLVGYRLFEANPEMASSVAALTVVAGGLYMLSVMSRPLTVWRAFLLLAMATMGVLILLVPALRVFFALQWPSLLGWGFVLGGFLTIALILEGVAYNYRRRFGKY
ncbi:cation-translocating P-type ATPase [Gleimia sp. 6138-11-ORH1]|uniref:cation-translocating P-type ATPase n=1 Tax=Gleimia sp. 6138-11-ORH1 TaxID=2973937 RepID=UPI00216AAEEF|nr:cation-translocating P-type ATPase [Gleimia sp. 6138-11-ORH1]MCS4484311.1 cation-translocating P-type ATPase [Gleimia sp. 6138-11-ORH1]